jgi:hypothetical protein
MTQRIEDIDPRYRNTRAFMREYPGMTLDQALSADLQKAIRHARSPWPTIAILGALILWAFAFRDEMPSWCPYAAMVIAVVAVLCLVKGRIDAATGGRRWFFRGRGPFGDAAEMEALQQHLRSEFNRARREMPRR